MVQVVVIKKGGRRPLGRPTVRTFDVTPAKRATDTQTETRQPKRTRGRKATKAQRAERIEIAKSRRCCIRETRELLVTMFPKCFMPRGADKFPLKIGIHKDIVGKGISRNKLRIALRDYTRGWKYRQALVCGADRVDLDGNPSGKVTEAQAEIANKIIP